MAEAVTAETTPRHPPGPAAASAGPGDEASRKARVLLVDDDPMLLRALGEMLARRIPEAEIETCSSPVAAVSIIGARGHDVVVSDLIMGGLSGLDLLERVKTLHPSALVVLITGAADRDLSVRAL